jgi:hypothetical protein
MQIWDSIIQETVYKYHSSQILRIKRRQPEGDSPILLPKIQIKEGSKIYGRNKGMVRVGKPN